MGAPRTRSYRPPVTLVAMMFIEGTGSGLWIPFSLLFFVQDRGFDIVTAGAALSIGNLAALALGALAVGSFCDRFGPFFSLTASCFGRALFFPCYLLADSPWQIVLIATADSIADRLFWASQGSLVGAITPDGSGHETLFATWNSMRNIGIGIGALAVTAVTASEGRLSHLFFVWVVLGNALSFAVAGVLVMLLRRPDGPVDRGPPGTDDSSYRSYRMVFRDRLLVLFTAGNFILALANTSLGSILPTYLLRNAMLPPWIAGAVLLTSCILIPALQPVAIRLADRFDRLWLITAASLMLCAYFVALPAVERIGSVHGSILLFVLVALFSVADVIIGATSMAVVLSFSPPDMRGRYGAFFQLSWGVNSIVYPFLFSALLAVSGLALWWSLAAGVAVAAGVFLLVRSRIPQGGAVVTDG